MSRKGPAAILHPPHRPLTLKLLVASNFKVRLAAALTLTCHLGFNDAVTVDVLNDAMATGVGTQRHVTDLFLLET
jgi:hypothetical protein